MFKFIFHTFSSYRRRNKIRTEWRIKNKHNTTRLEIIPDDLNFFNKVKVGKYTYGSIRAIYSSGSNEELIIGNYCSIGSGTTFLMGSEHPYNFISTFPFKVKIIGESHESTSKGKIELSDDVWIGENVFILSGVQIEQGAVVAAESVVVKNVPPYAIVGGNPAKIIKYRFSEDVIEKLLKIDYSLLDKDKIINNINDLYTEISSENIDNIINKLNLIK